METELGNVETINDAQFQITRRVSLVRKIVGYFLRLIAFVTNWQPLAKLRIYLDTFDVASLLIILVFNIIVFFTLCNGKCLSSAFSGNVKKYVFIIIIVILFLF